MNGIIRKFISGFTGIAWTLFIIMHLIGNLSLFSTDGTAFNKYAYLLESTGLLLIIAELALIVFLAMHAYTGIQVWLSKKKARPEDYKLYKSAGDKSKQSLSSRTMIFTGIVLLLFLVGHVATFKFNIFEPATTVQIDGITEPVRDLHSYVRNIFKNPAYAFGYTAVMLLLGLHLRHGVWSAVQSLGAMKPKYSALIYTIAGMLAALLAIGFLSIPLYIYFIAG